MAPKRNYPRIILRHLLYRAVGHDKGGLKRGVPLAANASDPQPLGAVTLKKHWQLATSALPVTIGRLQGGCCLAPGPRSTVGAQPAREPHTSTMAAAR